MIYFLKIVINALLIGFQIHVSTKYQYIRSFLIALIYTVYVLCVAPYVTFLYVYWFICLMLWLFAVASYSMRHKLAYETNKSGKAPVQPRQALEDPTRK